VPRNSVSPWHFGQFNITAIGSLYGFATQITAKAWILDSVRMGRAVFIASSMARLWQWLLRTRLDHMRRPPVRPHVRDGIHEEARQTLAMLRGCRQTINVVLVALSDGVELEVWADGTLRRRSRFLRDTEARKHFERLSGRLLRRGYRNDGHPR
jgi:hypothetical protein